MYTSRCLVKGITKTLGIEHGDEFLLCLKDIKDD